MTAPTATAEPETKTLDVPGAVLTYDVRSNPSSTERPLLIIGSPMGAAGFVTLAGHFTDRTVITYDPRSADRSQRTDGAAETTPEEHADDLHRLVDAVGLGPVDLFATSGGAVNALAFVARHADQVVTLVAHEPPTVALLPDREAAFAAVESVRDTYQESGFGPAMARFIALVSHEGPIPEDFATRRTDPAMFGLPTADDGTRGDALLQQNITSCTSFAPDIEALRGASTRIVMAVGEESGNVLAGRGGKAVAERLGIEPTIFPGGHDGFLGGEYGSTGKPDAFAAKLREVLDATS